jgi:DNA polymerase-1
MVVGWVYKYAIRLKATHIAFCFDGADNFRYGVYPDYKNGRSEDTSNTVYSAVPALRKALKEAGICWLQHPNYEADDLMGSFAHQATFKTYLVTRDKDANQSLNEHSIKYTPEMGTSPEIFLTKSDSALGGMTVLASLDYQTLVGDKIDSIPDVVSPGVAKKIIKEHTTLKAYFASKEGKQFWAVHHKALIRNRKLVTLVKDIELPAFEKFVPKPSVHPGYVAWKNTKHTLF